MESRSLMPANPNRAIKIGYDSPVFYSVRTLPENMHWLWNIITGQEWLNRYQYGPDFHNFIRHDRDTPYE